MLVAPEIELLLLCAHPKLDGDATHRLRALVQDNLNWHSVFELAYVHRVIPLVSHHLRCLAEDVLDSGISEQLHINHRNTIQQNMVLSMEVLRLVQLFETHGINVVPFKGPIAAMLAYGDLTLRAWKDIDLVVEPAEHNRAERLLVAEGYSVKNRYEDALQSCLWHNQRHICVDLHWGIPPKILRLDMKPFFEDLAPIRLLGRAISTFSPCDTFLLTAINATKEYWRPSIHRLIDIAAFASTYSDENWLNAFTRARQIGCQRMLVAATLLTHRLITLNLPRRRWNGLYSNDAINKVVDELECHLITSWNQQTTESRMKLHYHKASQAYFLTLTDSPIRRGRQWFKWATTPNEADRAFIRLPQALSLLYYLIRPFRLSLRRF